MADIDDKISKMSIFNVLSKMKKDNFYCTRKSILKCALGSFLGMFVGMVVSLTINLSIIELIFSPFFGMYFGIVFIIFGIFIISRIRSTQSSDPDINYTIQLNIFCILIIASGLICVFLPRNYIIESPTFIKVIIYSMLGISVAFTFSFAIIDMINVLIGYFQSSLAKPLVQSFTQVRFIVAMSLLMGCIFGCIFGLLEIDLTQPSQLRLAILRDQHYCYPIGALIGGLTGFGNQFFKASERRAWQRVNQSQFDEEL